MAWVVGIPSGVNAYLVKVELRRGPPVYLEVSVRISERLTPDTAAPDGLNWEVSGAIGAEALVPDPGDRKDIYYKVLVHHLGLF